MADRRHLLIAGAALGATTLGVSALAQVAPRVTTRPPVPGPAPSGPASLSSADLPPEPSTVVYPRHLPQQDSQVNYFIELVHLALQRSNTRYSMLPTRSEMVQSRALLEMAGEQASIDVFWTETDVQREGQLIPIRIPIDRGLIGWRLCLVAKKRLDLFRDLRRLPSLAAFTAGQMHDWPDTRILRMNGLPVHVGTHYQGLFQMLGKGRFDYFPRSIFEIDAELEAFSDLGLAIEPNLLLHYPAALYLFVRPGRPRLAADLAYGMESLVADGTFERLSQQQFRDTVARHGVDQRRVLRLRNPLLPPLTPVSRKGLWWPLPSQA